MKIILALLATTLISTQALAETVKHYQGKYTAKFVSAKTFETARIDLGEMPTQQGKFKLIFIRDNWKELSDEEKSVTYKKLVMKGVVTGRLDMSTGYASHVLTNNSRTGAMFTHEDILTPTAGDFLCSTQEALQANELMIFTHGAGIYANLTSGQVMLSGTINTCFGHPEFLQNDFQLANTESYLEFATIN